MTDHETAKTKRSAPDPFPGASRNRRTDPETASDEGAVNGRDRNGRDADSDGPVESMNEREAWPSWPPRDILAPFVLLAVSLQRAHGYVIEDYLRALGLFGITMSTLYRTLRQMEKDGFVESTWEPGPTGPARRVYTITDAGHTWLDSSASMLNAYRATIDRFFGLYDAGRPQPDGTSDQPADEKETT
ncbi:MAG TPA: helix-turn-helix transcriptional regulator [Candidatus Limnocylindrales bacterium]|nr:helix-turn-helix transcriptional regulator [Candidatus Limnocylindrales bacterium]